MDHDTVDCMLRPIFVAAVAAIVYPAQTFHFSFQFHLDRVALAATRPGQSSNRLSINCISLPQGTCDRFSLLLD